MAVLDFLGWAALAGDGGVPRENIAPPPGKAYWRSGDLYIENGKLHAPGILRFVVDGLAIELEFLKPLPLVQNGNSWAPSPGPSSALAIRMGQGGTTGTSRILVGPAAVIDDTWDYRFGVRGVARLSLVNRPLIDEGSGTLSPLLMSGGDGGMLVIDIGGAQGAGAGLMIEAGAIETDLRAVSAAHPASKRIVGMVNAPARLTFFSLAKQPAANLTLQFAPKAGQPDLALNVARSGDFAQPLVGVDLAGGQLGLLLGKSSNNALIAVLDAWLTPVAGSMRLRFHGMWNSRNDPEEWSCSARIAVGFRMGRGRDWCSTMIRPAEVKGLKRLTPSHAGNVMPIHGHIPGAQVVPDPARPASLMTIEGHAERDAALGPFDWRAGDSLWAVTRPWLKFEKADLRHPRPGASYQEGAWIFQPDTTSGGLPVLPGQTWREGAVRKHDLANAEIDLAFRGMLLASMKGEHETGLADATADKPRIDHVLPRLPDPTVKLPAGVSLAQTGPLSLALVQHQKALVLNAPPTAAIAARPAAPAANPLPLAVKVPVQASGFEYAVCWPNRVLPPQVATFTASDFADRIQVQIDISVPISIGTINTSAKVSTMPLALLKLGRDRGLKDLLDDLAAGAPAEFTAAAAQALLTIGKVNPDLLDKNWVGLFAFDLPLDFTKFAALNDTIPLDKDDSPKLLFFAMSPKASAGAASATGEVSISAGVDWKSLVAPPSAQPSYDAQQPTQEVSFWPTHLEISFRDNRLTTFRSEAVIQFRSFFGVGNTFGSNATNRSINILGSAQRKDPALPDSPVEFRFAAEVPEPWQLYPIKDTTGGGNGGSSAGNESFLKGVWFKRLELVDAPEQGTAARRSKVSIDGSIEFQKPSNLGAMWSSLFSKIDGRLISFRDLGISLLGSASLDPRFLEISYPSLSFDLDFPHLNLFGDALRMKLQQLALNWGDSAFQFPGFLDLGLGNASWLPDKPHVFFIGKIDFGSLPALFSRSLSGFSLELGLGLNFDKANAILTGGRSIVIRGFGFEGLNLDLLSFLEVSIKSLTLGQLPGGTRKGAQLGLNGVSVKVLHTEIFTDASGGYFSLADGAGDGFWAYFPLKQPKPFLGCFEWGFVAQNVDFEPSVAKLLLVPPTNTEVSGDAKKAVDAGKALSDAWSKGQIAPARADNPHGWTFAAGITLFNEMLSGRVLIQDAGYAGLAIWGDKLKEWFGYDFSFCGIYRKDVTPGQDYFYISTTLPGITVSAVRFTGGTIAVEVYTSGSFMLDFGFPWPGPDGGRQWRRTIGAIITPGQASAGFYLRKIETDTADGKQLVLGAGFAVQWGLGAAFDGGIFKVWVRIGLYAALEGQATLLLSKPLPGGGEEKRFELTSLIVSGAGGVLLEGEGAIDWWIISVRVHVSASAEVRLRLEWHNGQQTQIDMVAELYVSASAEACVGGGCFKICRSISVGLDISASHQLKF